jgi:protease-4
MIVAEPNTITGSIGVFGMFINAQNLLNNKLGLKFEKVKFGEYSDLGSPDRPMTAAEKAIMQKMIDRIYDDFISRVAEGRNLTKAQVDSIAQGRVSRVGGPVLV